MTAANDGLQAAREAGRWRCQPRLTSEERAAVLQRLGVIERELGREPIDGGFRRSIAHDGPGLHWLRTDDERRIAGYAYATLDETPTVELAGGGYDADLRSALHARAAVMHWWMRGEVPMPPDAEVLRTLAFMTVPLPIEGVALPADVSKRSFEPGRDEAAWLDLNNLAFAVHPEQGGWRLDDLLEREREPWFDRRGFLLFECGGVLAASIWMRVHERPQGRLGEVMVVAVHPDFRGRRLGQVAVTHGLDAVAGEGIETGTLYVDESNGPAMALYRGLGFTVARRDRLVALAR